MRYLYSILYVLGLFVDDGFALALSLGTICLIFPFYILLIRSMLLITLIELKGTHPGEPIIIWADRSDKT